MEFRGIVSKAAMLATAGLIAAGMSSAASAESFNFAGPDTNHSNTLNFTGSEGTGLKVTGMSLSGSSIIGGTLSQNSYGLVFTHNQSDDSHTIDNSGAKDFLVLQFDHVVNFDSLGYTVWGDTDMIFGAATLGSPFSASNKTALDQIFGSYTYSAGNSPSNGTYGTRTVNLSGNTFLVGTPTNQSDDKFKIKAAAITTPSTPAVPEPASWAMMIGGFGIAGAAMRRRAGQTNLRLA